MTYRALFLQPTSMVMMATLLAACPGDDTSATSVSDSDSDTDASTSGDSATTNTTTADSSASADSGSSDGTTTASTTMTTTDTDSGSSSSDTATATDSGSSSDSGSTTDVGPVCGDGVVDAGEDCDGADLGGATCMSEGFDGGRLGCAGDCTLDTTGCNVNCGNGTIEDPEECDGANLNGLDCTSQGFDAGALACSRGCTLDTTGCISFMCGNNAIEGAELCDGTDLGGVDCIGLGYDGGELACDVGCAAYDPSGCTGTNNCCEAQVEGVTGCGDDACEAAVCGIDAYCCDNTWDGICVNEAYALCPTTCITTCGDGLLTGAELCDGADLGGQDCVSQGFASGTLACSGTCDGFDTTACVPFPGPCCQASTVAGCQDQACQDAVCALDPFCCDDTWDGQCANEAATAPACLGFESCPAATCGDGIVSAGEVCDGADLGGATCQTLGYPAPTNNCCFANGGPGCEDGGCEATVCGVDGFCCSNTWDSICAGEAADLCGSLCANTLGCDVDCDGFDASGCSQALPACVEEDIGTATGAAVTAGDTTGEDDDFAQACGGGGSVDHVVHFIATETGTYSFDLLGSGYDTVLSAYTDCGGAELACNDDSLGTLQSTISLDLVDGQAVLLAVSGYSGNTGAWTLNITPPAPAFPAVCDSGVDAISGQPWVVCSADDTGAWISAAAGAGGNYHATQICQSLGYSDFGQFGGTCGNECGYCEPATACDAVGTQTFDGQGDCGIDAGGQVLCDTVTWTCVP
ncbi:MAG: hypothetical protein K1X88_22480 [Nannocystaceae bacterium]|nr:hypothetical protein [Nannocystaceae bacterium]